MSTESTLDNIVAAGVTLGAAGAVFGMRYNVGNNNFNSASISISNNPKLKGRKYILHLNSPHKGTAKSNLIGEYKSLKEAKNSAQQYFDGILTWRKDYGYKGIKKYIGVPIS